MSHVTWVPAAGFEGMYEVSSAGDVRSWRVGGSRNKRAKEPRMLVLALDGDGYRRCNLYDGKGGTRNVAVHVLMCASWHGARPEGAQVRHLNGVRTDNSKDNLRWGTAKENYDDMTAHGTRAVLRGEDNHFTKLTEAQVVDIRTRKAASKWELAEEYGVSPSTVYQIRARRTWRHVA